MSNANGTYSNVFGQPTAIDLGGSGGCVVRNNLIMNCAQMVSATSFNDSLYDSNTGVCNPVALGASTSNVGIGNILNPADGFRYIVVNCDPTSAMWNQLLNVCVRSASAQPSTGTYIAQIFVENNAKAVVGKGV